MGPTLLLDPVAVLSHAPHHTLSGLTLGLIDHLIDLVAGDG